jgi:glycosyltransferase involved in cell wall biosynthesis
MIPEKGFDLLLRAFAQCATVNKQARLRLAGDGPQRSALIRAAADLGIVDRVEMVGWVDDITAFFAGIDVFVFPSRPEFDGLPNVILEAMALGRPVVATDVGGVASVIEDGVTGYLVPPLDVAALAAAMERAATADGRLRDAALARVQEAHDRRVEATAVSALYRSLLDRSQLGGSLRGHAS